MFIMQFHTSNVWKIANHTIFIHFQKIIEKRFELVSAASQIKSKLSGDEKNDVSFFLKKWLSFEIICMTSVF